MPTPQKEAAVAALREKLERAQAAIITDYRGLTVPDIQALRAQLRPSGTEYAVVKNTLLRLAVSEQSDALSALLQGPTAVAFCYTDLAAGARAVGDFARTSRVFSVKGGLLGARVVSPAEVAQLATIPPRQQLLAQVYGGIQAPVANLIGLLQASIGNLYLLVHARAEQLQPGVTTQEAAA
jgi:large subunit ribosomal protein L10